MGFSKDIEKLKKLSFVLFTIIIVVVAFLVLQNYERLSTSLPIFKPQKQKPTRNVYIGFWTHGFWDDNTQSINPKKLEEIEDKIDKKVAIANYYRGWQHLGQEKEIVNELDAISSHGWRPMVSTNPYFSQIVRQMENRYIKP